MNVTINKVNYRVEMPRNGWDMNFHFIEEDGTDCLLDLHDILDWTEGSSATIAQAVDYAREMIAETGDDTSPFWKIKEA